MSAQFWLSMVMGVVGIAGLLIAGKGRWQGWLIGLLVQPVWVAYFIITEGYPGVILPVAYGVVYAKNLLSWRRKAAEQQRDEHLERVRLLAREVKNAERFEALTNEYVARVLAYNDAHDLVNQSQRALGQALGVPLLTEEEYVGAKFYPRYAVEGATMDVPTRNADGDVEWMGLRSLVQEAVRRLREEETMGLTKHGHGEILKEDTEPQKTASMSTEDAEALAQENAEADR